MDHRRDDVARMRPALRPLRAEDADAFAALVRHAFAGQGVQPAPSALRLTAADVRSHLASGGGVTTEPAQAGLLWMEQEGGLYVSRVAVHPSCRGLGIAAALVAAAEAEAARRGLPRLWLSTRLAMDGNRRLFRRCGFVETGRHAHPGFAEPTSVDMEKRVGAPEQAGEGCPTRDACAGGHPSPNRLPQGEGA